MTQLAIHGGTACVPAAFRRFPHPLFFDGLKTDWLQGIDAVDYDGGGIISSFEGRFAQWSGRTLTVSTNSGTSALATCFVSLGLTRGDRVIVPAYTFFATVTPLVHLGCTLIPIDCDLMGNICIDSLEKAMEQNPKAVVVTHMWGHPCDMRRIVSLCESAGCFLVEDASHAHGATLAGRMAGAYGTVSAWSLGAKKILTGGQGGILATDDEEIYQRAILYSHYNRRSRRDVTLDHLRPFAVSGTGMNLRMHPYAAALLMRQMDQIDNQLAERREVAQYLHSGLGGIDGFELPQVDDGSQPAWYAYTIRLKDRLRRKITRDRLVEALQAEGALDIDAPGATRPIVDYPFIFKSCVPNINAGAREYYDTMIKMPTWYGPDRIAYADAYITALRKVVDVALAGAL